MKRLVLATLMAASASAFASQYFVVVPLPGSTAKPTTPNIGVALSAYVLPTGLIGQPYAGFDFKSVLSVTGDPNYAGTGVTWSVASGSLPAGLTLNSDGTLTGTPTASGTASFQVKAAYKTQGGQQTYQLLVSNLTVNLAAATPATAIVGQPYSYDLKPLLIVSGDNAYTGADVTWSVVSTSLPAGLYLTADGRIGGTPTVAGTGSVTARATYRGINGQQTYQVVTLAIQVSLKSDTPPQALIGQAYNYDLKQLLSVTGDSAYNGTDQVTWSIASGALPAGLSLGASGVITGIPSASAVSGPVTIQASYRGVSGQQTYQIVALLIQVSLDTASLPKGKVGVAYAPYDFKALATVTGDSGYNSQQASFTASNLPAGLSMSNGVLSGTPTNQSGLAGNSFQVVASYRGVTGQQTYTIFVEGQYLTVVKITAGDTHTCAVTSSGGAKCWGINMYGQLGNNSTTTSRVPVDVYGLTSGVANIVAGSYHTCAITTAGAAKCWGNNSNGQLGNNSSGQSNIPTDVYGMTSGVAAISPGYYHTCAVTTAGGAKCWGANQYGQLGNNSTTQSLVPVSVSGLTTGVAQVMASEDYHSCALTTAGGVKCWGYNNVGQLGNGTTNQSPVPVDVSGLTSGVSSISIGSNAACVLTSAGGVKCWGSNTAGRLGNGVTTNSSVPVNVTGLSSGVSSVSSRHFNSCAITTAGGLLCWGWNIYGQLGTGNFTDSSVPVSVPGMTSGTASVAVGTYHTCISTSAGTAKCWGHNNAGQLGNNNNSDSLVPVTVLNP
ncbi:RCC1 domain-containing protein [Burkholderia ubonensis]|uniref:RCC1 domain-containing protein n=1 Tax=Burkholderia ubonensis TaxID=101571 RepID=UPI0009B3DA7E|nr:putative Ig domain-containing protein [Burkholderia ubonensis]